MIQHMRKRRDHIPSEQELCSLRQDCWQTSSITSPTGAHEIESLKLFIDSVFIQYSFHMLTVVASIIASELRTERLHKPHVAERGLPDPRRVLKASRAGVGDLPNSAERHVGKRGYTE